MGVSASALAMAKLEVMRAVGAIDKDGENTNQHYKFASEKHIVEVMRAAMLEHGLAMYPSSASDVQVIPRQKGGWLVVWVQTYTLVHAPTGQAERIQVVTSGFDTLDKGAFKGMTGALKYALRQAFLISIGGDDAENDKTSNEPKPPPKGFANQADEAGFYDAVSNLLKQQDVDRFIAWMRNAQGVDGWPGDVADSTHDWRLWFCKFMDGDEKVGGHVGLVWYNQWLVQS